MLLPDGLLWLQLPAAGGECGKWAGLGVTSRDFF